MAPKYHHETYHLGTNYPKWTDEQKDVVDQAMNMIQPGSPAGAILNGPTGSSSTPRIFFLTNAQSHVGTDNAGLDHVNFVIKTLGTGGEQTPECHLYPNGSYTTSGNSQPYPGFPAGKVLPAAATVMPIPTDADFPPLGGTPAKKKK